MWKRICIICWFVLVTSLLSEQMVYAAIIGEEEMSSALELQAGDYVITKMTYYKYTATEPVNIIFDSSNIVSGKPWIVIYDADGAEIYDEGTSWKAENIYTSIHMQKGQTYYFQLYSHSGTPMEYDMSIQIKEGKGIKNITVLDNPGLTDYYELSEELQSFYFQDLRIQVEWEDGTVTTEKYSNYSDWMIRFGTVNKNGTYKCVYYRSYPILLKYNSGKNIEDISVKSVKEREEMMISYQQGDWCGYSFTPERTGYYDVTYSVTGACRYVILNEDGEKLLQDNVGVGSLTYNEFSITESGREEHKLYFVEGHRYYLYGCSLARRTSGKFVFKKATVQQGYPEITVEPLRNVSYTGAAQEPKPVVKYRGTDVTELGWYVDYNYFYNVKPGVAMIEITCFEDGSYSYYYDYRCYTSFIIRKPLEKATVTIQDYSYTGSTIVPKAVVTLDGKILKQGTDYTVKAKNNVDAGTATATITGIGRYEGSIEKTFVIRPVSWTLEVEDTFIKNKKSKAFLLKAKSEASLTYTSSNEKIAKVDDTGKVTVKKYGTAVITITAAADNNHKEIKKSVTVIVTSKASKIKSVKKIAKAKALVKLKAAQGAQGYEITYSTDKTFKSGVKKVMSKKPTATLKKLKKTKKYYIRVRSYRKANGKKLYSDYSKTKTYRH